MTDIEPYSERRTRSNFSRSPSYPALDLEKAIERARELYAKDKQFPIPVQNAVRTWGYKSLNGPAGIAVAALKKYGLLDDEGARNDRRIRVTNLAVAVMSHPDPSARTAAIRDAALRPTIHAEMWAGYGLNLPSDDSLAWTLTREMGFTDTGAREFIKEYRRTLSFARMDEDPERSNAQPQIDVAERPVPQDASHEEAADSKDAFRRVVERWSPSTHPAVGGQEQSPVVVSYPIPVARTGKPPVMLTGAFPLTAGEWHQFMTVLKAMKPVLAEGDDEASDDPEDD